MGALTDRDRIAVVAFTALAAVGATGVVVGTADAALLMAVRAEVAVLALAVLWAPVSLMLPLISGRVQRGALAGRPVEPARGRRSGAVAGRRCLGVYRRPAVYTPGRAVVGGVS